MPLKPKTMNSLFKGLVLSCLVVLTGLCYGSETPKSGDANSVQDCQGQLSANPSYLVTQITERDARVRIIPIGRYAPDIPKYEFEVAGVRLNAVIVTDEAQNSRLEIKEIKNDQESELLFVLPLEGGDQSLLAGKFDTAFTGDHGLLTLQTGREVYVLSVDKPAAE